jgi:hypothetical protein
MTNRADAVDTFTADRSWTSPLTRRDRATYWTTTGLVVAVMLSSALTFAFNPASGDPVSFEIGHATFFISLVVSYLYYHKRVGRTAPARTGPTLRRRGRRWLPICSSFDVCWGHRVSRERP